jgi:hypothetical protein
MGQPVTVVKKPSSRPGVIRYEINRAITGMGHERYKADTEVTGDRPADVLARRLLDHGGIDGVHINANVITLDLQKGADTTGIEDVISDMFIYYRPGVEVPSFEE